MVWWLVDLLDDLGLWCIFFNIIPKDVGRSSCRCYIYKDKCAALCYRLKQVKMCMFVFVCIMIILFLRPLRLGQLCGIFYDVWGVPHNANCSITARY